MEEFVNIILGLLAVCVLCAVPSIIPIIIKEICRSFKKPKKTKPKEPKVVSGVNNIPSPQKTCVLEEHPELKKQIESQFNDFMTQIYIEEINKQDKKEYSECLRVCKENLPKLIGILKKITGGEALINKINNNISLFIKEFIVFCVAYKNLFYDKDGRGFFKDSKKYDFYNGAYRLCKILKLSTANNLSNTNVLNTDVDWIENRMSFYKKEICYVIYTKHALPINLLYPLFNPDKDIDESKYVTEIDPISCVMLWGMIKKIVDSIQISPF